jgi:hypothetical protein
MGFVNCENKFILKLTEKVSQRQAIFFIQHRVKTGFGVHSSMGCVPKTFPPWLKCPGREAVNSHLVLRLRMYEAIPQPLHSFPLCIA